MPRGFEEIYSEYSRLNDPEQQEIELQRRIDLANPQLRRLLTGIGSRLNRMGMGSAAPFARATTRATSEFTGDITRSYFENLDEQRMGLLGIMARIESEERRRKSEERAALWAGIGRIGGQAFAFIPGLGGG